MVSVQLGPSGQRIHQPSLVGRLLPLLQALAFSTLEQGGESRVCLASVAQCHGLCALDVRSTHGTSAHSHRRSASPGLQHVHGIGRASPSSCSCCKDE